MMNGTQARLKPDGPAALAGAPAEIDIFVIEKEIAVEAAELIETVPAQQQTTARHPGHSRAAPTVDAAILPPGTRHRQPGEGSRQGRKWPRRELTTAVAVAQREADDAGLAILGRE